jgi:hypothetical protein
MKIKREEGTERGQKFLELNQKHGREGLKERAHRRQTNMELMYCVDILKLTGEYIPAKGSGSVKRLAEYKKIETLAQAAKYITESIQKDNVIQSAIDFEKKHGAKQRCIDEINYENHFVKLEKDLRAIQSVIDWLPSTRGDNKWENYATHPRLAKYARPSASRGLRRSKRKSNTNTRL